MGAPVLEAPPRTTRWHASELAEVEGLAVCYTRDPDCGLVYRLPGGGAVTRAEIDREGWRFVPPARVRDWRLP